MLPFPLRIPAKIVPPRIEQTATFYISSAPQTCRHVTPGFQAKTLPSDARASVQHEGGATMARHSFRNESDLCIWCGGYWKSIPLKTQLGQNV